MRKFFIAKGFEDFDIILPKRETVGSAGYDIRACVDTVVEPGKTKLINTGVKVSMESNEVLKIYPRSSLAKKKGLFLANHVGIIDSDYYSNETNDGHIMINVYNYTDKPVTVLKNERIAQGIFSNYLITIDDSASGNRDGGFGSTNK